MTNIEFFKKVILSEIELCRLCTNAADQTNTEKLFERNQRKLLGQVEALLGQRLNRTKDLPQHICKPCEEQTQQAHAFRQRCLEAQQHFATQQKRSTKKIKQQKRLELNAADVKLKESDKVVETAVEKEKEGEDESNKLDDALHLLNTTDVLHNNESATNSDNGDDRRSDDDDDDDEEDDVVNKDDFTSSFGYHQTADDDKEDILNIEPEISLAAAAPAKETLLLPSQKELPPYKKVYARRKVNLICEVCGKHFKNAAGFKRHKLMHAGIRQFQCEQCPKNFMSKPELRIHIRVHTGEKPYACRYCDHRFKDSTGRTIHERYHTNVRPFACDLCDKAFTKSSHLTRHTVAHTGERPYKCSLCNVTFPFTKNLNQHFTTLKHKQSVENQQTLVNQTTDVNETML